MYRAFYSMCRLGDVPAEQAHAVELAEVYSDIFPRMKEHREFFGLIDAHGSVLQAMYDGDADRYWFEVPRPDKQGSYGANLSFDAAMDLLKSLDGPIPEKGFEGFEFQAW